MPEMLYVRPSIAECSHGWWLESMTVLGYCITIFPLCVHAFGLNIFQTNYSQTSVVRT